MAQLEAGQMWVGQDESASMEWAGPPPVFLGTLQLGLAASAFDLAAGSCLHQKHDTTMSSLCKYCMYDNI